jgi:MYXO-CTERM domain-containing protein
MRSLSSLASAVMLLSLPASAANPAPAPRAPAASPVPPVAIVGTVLARDSAWQGGVIVSRARISVDRVMRGQVPAVIEVTTLGGRVDDIAQIASGSPALPAGPRVAIELWPRGASFRLASVAPPPDASMDLAEASSYVRGTTHDSEKPCAGEIKPVYWPVVEVPWVLDDACSDDVGVDACEAAVVASFQAWQDVSCAYLAFPYRGRMTNAPIGYDTGGSNLNVVKWFESDWPGMPGQVALTLTTVGCSTGQLKDADLLINGVDASFTVAPVAGEGRSDIQNTITHEAGHVAGFAHSPDPESTMFATASMDESKKRDLTTDDAQGLCDVYPLGSEPGGDDGCGCRAAGGGAARVPVVMLALIVVLSVRRRSSRNEPRPASFGSRLVD